MAALLAVALLTSCGQYAAILTPAIDAPSADDLVGTWVHHGDAADGASMQFYDDGTVEFGGVPSEVFFDPFASSDDIAESDSFVSGSGEWFVPDQERQPFPEISIEISASADFVDGLNTTMHLSDLVGEGARVYFEVGDPDQVVRFRFEKEQHSVGPGGGQGLHNAGWRRRGV